MSAPAFNSKSRLMMIAPHPDDESLAAGVLLQKAIASGAAVRIVYATDGDDNPWPQRALERKWRLNDLDRQRWGRLRRREAITALETLGLRATDARFLGLPDQGLTRLLLHDCRQVSARIARVIADWSPTHLLLPSIADTHPDHSALALLLRYAIARSRAINRINHWYYIVHGNRKLFARKASELPQSEKEQAKKQKAIACHRTQTKFSRRRFMGYAKRAEFFCHRDEEGLRARGSVRLIRRRDDQLHLLVRYPFQPWRRDKTTLYVSGYDRTHAPICLGLYLPTSDARVQVTDCANGKRLGLATYLGNAYNCKIAMPTNRFALDRPLFVKVDRRLWFFDEAGWIEIQREKSRVQVEPAQVKIAA